MSQQRMRDLVAEKLDTETRQADEIALNLVKSKTLLTDQRIRDFFPHYEKQWGPSRSNLPLGIPMATQIVYGLPATFDLHAEGRLQFELRYGIDLHTAITLVDRGRLLPNLYVRDPAAWVGCDDLRELVHRSTANGVRVEAYLQARFPQHTDRISQRRDLGQSILNDLCKRDRSSYEHVLERLSANKKSAGTVLGRRWAYVDSFAADASETFGRLLKEAKWDTALDYLTVVQHLTVSPISGALGGQLIWGREHLQMLHRVLSGPLHNEARATGSIGPWVHAGVESHTDPEVMSFLASHLGGAGALEFLDRATATALLTITDDPEFAGLRKQFHAAADELSIATGQEKTLEASVQQWAGSAKEMRAKLSAYKKTGEIVFRSSAVFGCFLNRWIAAGVGAMFCLSPTPGGWIGSHLHGLMHPAAHRFITTLEDIERLKSDNC